MKTALKISLTGPESSGKTTLSRDLSAFFEWPLVPEFARHFLSSGGKVQRDTDLIWMVHQQIRSENLSRSAISKGIICDTDLVVLKVWCLEKFGSPPPALNALCLHHRYDLTLLCRPDIQWEPDPLRENALDRDRLFQRYLHELENLKVNFRIVEGLGKARTHQAIKFVEEYLKHH